MVDHRYGRWVTVVPPSGGSLEIGNCGGGGFIGCGGGGSSPFGGIPRNWKLNLIVTKELRPDEKFPLRGDP